MLLGTWFFVESRISDGFYLSDHRALVIADAFLEALSESTVNTIDNIEPISAYEAQNAINAIDEKLNFRDKTGERDFITIWLFLLAIRWPSHGRGVQSQVTMT